MKSLQNLMALQAKSVFSRSHSNKLLFQRLQNHPLHCLHQDFPPKEDQVFQGHSAPFCQSHHGKEVRGE